MIFSSIMGMKMILIYEIGRNTSDDYKNEFLIYVMSW